jgi:hypothetical protein
MAVIRAYPREQFLRSSVNVLTQLEYFDLVGFGLSSDAGAEMHKAFPQAETSYLHSRQAHDNLPLHFFNWVHRAGVVASLIVVAVLLPWLWRVRPRSLIALGFVIAVCIGANALSAATLSGVNGRYGSRIIWLVPFFALLCAFQRAGRSTEQTTNEPQARSTA